MTNADETDDEDSGNLVVGYVVVYPRIVLRPDCGETDQFPLGIIGWSVANCARTCISRPRNCELAIGASMVGCLLALARDLAGSGCASKFVIAQVAVAVWCSLGCDCDEFPVLAHIRNDFAVNRRSAKCRRLRGRLTNGTDLG